MTYLKHSGSNGKQPKKSKTAKKQPATAARIDYAADYIESDDRHSRCVEEALDGLTSVISTYVTQARNGDNGAGLYSDPSGYPVKVALTFEDEDGMGIGVYLHSEALDSIADSFKRIADAMTARHVNEG
jgi:hypothetical protein